MSAASLPSVDPNPAATLCCAYCGEPGAWQKCSACEQRAYCNQKCQKNDWKKEHKEECKRLQQGGIDTVVVAAVDTGSGGEPESPCPLCLDNEDSAVVGESDCGMCLACGQFYCGACWTGTTFKQMAKEQSVADDPNMLCLEIDCPTCRAPFLQISLEEKFERCRKLVHDRPPGRYTPTAQYTLGNMYIDGDGVKKNSTEGLKYIELAASQGLIKAQFKLGNMYVHGEGVKQDGAKAVKYFTLASRFCKSAGDPAFVRLGFVKAQHNLGTIYNVGQGVKQDRTKAVKHFKLAADQGCSRSQYNLGTMYHDGLGVKQDVAKAAKYFKLAAAQGDAIAQYNLGNMYHDGFGVKQDVAKAVKYFKMAADQGDVTAQYNLGIMYNTGSVVKHDGAKAAKYFKLAADQGYVQAQYNLGSIYEQQQNGAEAVKYYKLVVADQNVASAATVPSYVQSSLYNLGCVYREGKCVKQDSAKAAMFYRRAAESGHAFAQQNLGQMYYSGDGVLQDNAEAAKYYKLAAVQGQPHSQHVLGELYAVGNGVPQDYTEALKWFHRAAEQGTIKAVGALDQMQENGMISAPSPGTAVATTLLSSSKYNKRSGVVVKPTGVIGPGRVSVLLDGETRPISLKLKNLKVI